MYRKIDLQAEWQDHSPEFIEGAVLAANLTTKPLQPESWLTSIVEEPSKEQVAQVEQQIHAQFAMLKRSEYSLLAQAEGSDEMLADLAEGFMTVWPVIEEQWQELSLSDGTVRMLQALLTTLMLAIDEEQTQVQMREAGIEPVPALAELKPQLDLMVNEVALAADEALAGGKAQSVNPYKSVGRNDACPCGSGKKFKQCCGKN